MQLAARYAQAIDDAEDMAEALAKLGPKLLAVLDALGATPRGRAAVQSRGEAEAIPPTVPTAQQQAGGGASTALERLRAERANRR